MRGSSSSLAERERRKERLCTYVGGRREKQGKNLPILLYQNKLLFEMCQIHVCLEFLKQITMKKTICCVANCVPLVVGGGANADKWMPSAKWPEEERGEEDAAFSCFSVSLRLLSLSSSPPEMWCWICRKLMPQCHYFQRENEVFAQNSFHKRALLKQVNWRLSRMFKLEKNFG